MLFTPLLFFSFIISLLFYCSLLLCCLLLFHVYYYYLLLLLAVITALYIAVRLRCHAYCFIILILLRLLLLYYCFTCHCYFSLPHYVSLHDMVDIAVIIRERLKAEEIHPALQQQRERWKGEVQRHRERMVIQNAQNLSAPGRQPSDSVSSRANATRPTEGVRLRVSASCRARRQPVSKRPRVAERPHIE
jgi:hypothetical protein